MKLFDRSEGLIFSVSLFALVTSEEMKLQFVMRAFSLPFHHMQSLFKLKERKQLKKTMAP